MSERRVDIQEYADSYQREVGRRAQQDYAAIKAEQDRALVELEQRRQNAWKPKPRLPSG